MTKEVMITIKGLQTGAQEDAMITAAPGTYHLTNGKHYIQYEENSAESDAVSKNTLKLAQNQIVLLKKGAQYSQMDFDLSERTQAVYQTPYGALTLEISTKRIELIEADERMEVILEYSLYSDASHLSDHSISILIEAKI